MMNHHILILFNDGIINHIKTLIDLWLMSSALVVKKWPSLKQRFFWK